MSSFDDYSDEMPDELESFVAGVRAAATRMPAPSPILAHLLANGVSSPQKKRSIVMRVQASLAGLGVAAKVMLGAGVAAAAAGAATFGPVEFSPAKEHSVTAGGDGKDRHKDGQQDKPVVVVEKTTTTTVKPVEEPPVKTTTTTVKPYVAPKPKPPTSTTIKYVEPNPDKPTTTSTTKPPKPDVRHDIALTCTPNAEPTKVMCSWSATASPEHRYYKLVRTNADGSDWQKLYKSEDHREFYDTTALAGHSYKYFVYSLRDDGNVVAESNAVLVSCC